MDKLDRFFDTLESWATFWRWAFRFGGPIAGFVAVIWAFAKGQHGYWLIAIFCLTALLFLLLAIAIKYWWPEIRPRKPFTIQGPTGAITRKWATPRELRKKNKIEERTIGIWDVVKDGVISDKTFWNCTFIGPAIIYPAEEWVVHNCHWADALSPMEMFQPIETTTPKWGVIASTGCQFHWCIFSRIPFRVKQSRIDAVRKEWDTGAKKQAGWLLEQTKPKSTEPTP